MYYIITAASKVTGIVIIFTQGWVKVQIQAAAPASLSTSDYSSAISMPENDSGDETALQPEQFSGNEAAGEGETAEEGEAREELTRAGEEAAENNPRELTEEEEQQVRELERIDRKVRNHEQAHVAAGGRHVRGGPTYEYEEGPDGRRYAVGGSVSLDTSEEGDPEETIQKMREVRQAALAPADPSPEDHRVAQQANQSKMQARMEKQQEEQEEEGEEAAGPQTIEDFAQQRGGIESEASEQGKAAVEETGAVNQGRDTSQIFNPSAAGQASEAALNLLV